MQLPAVFVNIISAKSMQGSLKRHKKDIHLCSATKLNVVAVVWLLRTAIRLRTEFTMKLKEEFWTG